MDLIVHINGWPGSGKLTIARILAQRLAGRLIDNHTLLNSSEVLFERADPLHASLRKAVRASVLDHAARLPPGVPLLFTDALADDASDRALFEEYRGLADRRKARLAAIVLDCDHEENVRRLTSPGRSERHKLVRPEVLAGLRARYQLWRPPGCIEIDISNMSAEAVAAAIETALPAPAQH